MLSGLLGHLLPQLQHVKGGHWDGHAPVEHPFPGHLGVNDLQRAVGGGRGLDQLGVTMGHIILARSCSIVVIPDGCLQTQNNFHVTAAQNCGI